VANPGSSSHDETVSPKGDKEFCSNARENLLKACPASNEGKSCKSKAKSIFNSCYKDAKAQSESKLDQRPPQIRRSKLIEQFACRHSLNNNKRVSRASYLHQPPGNHLLLTRAWGCYGGTKYMLGK
jgi:hypothetical protein